MVELLTKQGLGGMAQDFQTFVEEIFVFWLHLAHIFAKDPTAALVQIIVWLRTNSDITGTNYDSVYWDTCMLHLA